MALIITNTQISSSEVGVTASYRDGFWHVTSHPGRAFDRNQAITALTLAEERAKTRPNEVLIASLEGELR